MEQRVIGFVPPIVGIDGEFNTFRLGQKLFTDIVIGERVFLMDEKNRKVVGEAEVIKTDIGTLADMCLIHGHRNHTEIGKDEMGAPERLFKTVQKIYGPHIATLHKKTTVIYLRRLE